MLVSLLGVARSFFSMLGSSAERSLFPIAQYAARQAEKHRRACSGGLGRRAQQQRWLEPKSPRTRCVKTYLEALLMVFMQDGGDDDGDEMGLVCRCIGFKSLMYEMWPGLRRDHDYEMEW